MYTYMYTYTFIYIRESPVPARGVRAIKYRILGEYSNLLLFVEYVEYSMQSASCGASCGVLQCGAICCTVLQYGRAMRAIQSRIWRVLSERREVCAEFTLHNDPIGFAVVVGFLVSSCWTCCCWILVDFIGCRMFFPCGCWICCCVVKYLLDVPTSGILHLAWSKPYQPEPILDVEALTHVLPFVEGLVPLHRLRATNLRWI